MVKRICLCWSRFQALTVSLEAFVEDAAETMEDCLETGEEPPWNRATSSTKTMLPGWELVFMKDHLSTEVVTALAAIE